MGLLGLWGCGQRWSVVRQIHGPARRRSGSRRGPRHPLRVRRQRHKERGSGGRGTGRSGRRDNGGRAPWRARSGL